MTYLKKMEARYLRMEDEAKRMKREMDQSRQDEWKAKLAEARAELVTWMEKVLPTELVPLVVLPEDYTGLDGNGTHAGDAYVLEFKLGEEYAPIWVYVHKRKWEIVKILVPVKAFASWSLVEGNCVVWHRDEAREFQYIDDAVGFALVHGAREYEHVMVEIYNSEQAKEAESAAAFELRHDLPLRQVLALEEIAEVLGNLSGRVEASLDGSY